MRRLPIEVALAVTVASGACTTGDGPMRVPEQPRIQVVSETVPAAALDEVDANPPPRRDRDDDDDGSAVLGVLGAVRDLGAAWLGLLIDRPAR